MCGSGAESGGTASGGAGGGAGDSDFEAAVVAPAEEIPLAQAIVLAKANVSSNIKKIFNHRGRREAQGKQILVVVGRFMFSL